MLIPLSRLWRWASKASAQEYSDTVKRARRLAMQEVIHMSVRDCINALENEDTEKCRCPHHGFPEYTKEEELWRLTKYFSYMT